MTPNPRRSSAPLTVRRLAQQGGVTVQVVRNYLRRGLLRASIHTDAGYQLFAPSEVRRLHVIRTAQLSGFTLAESKRILRRSRQRKSSCPLVRDIIDRRLDETREQLEHLLALQRRMAGAAAHCATLPDSVPTGNDVCALIEAIAASAAPTQIKSSSKRLLGHRASHETAL